MDTEYQSLLRRLPAVQKIMDEAVLCKLQERYGRDAVLEGVRRTLNTLRSSILAGQINGTAATLDSAEVARRAAQNVEDGHGSGVHRIINGTGVILHTGLGRAVLPPAALEHIANELKGYAAVEVEIASGKRGHRDETVRSLLISLLGCAHATIVNNNAAATLLALAAVARGKEVVVSRGQLVEIGGSFRVPDVMAESGCRLVEAGTTNRTYAGDYEKAITGQTAALMLIHTSNFRVVGFTHEPSVRELSALARKFNIPLIYDIGSGSLLPDLAPELKEEPVVRTALEDGADLVLFSADKILGSAQGGIAAGRHDLIEKMRSHPLYRAFRVDKLTLCAIEATLRLYLNPARRDAEIPTLKMLRRSLENIGTAAAELATRLGRALPGLEAICVEDSSRLGSGSLPERNIPTRVVSLRHTKLSAEELGRALRDHNPPIFTRIQDERVLIDPRTLLEGDAEEIGRAVSSIDSRSAK